nr:hypothetical protein [Tanacetum cinerariifolium]
MLSFYTILQMVEIDFAKVVWEDIIHKLNNKSREIVVPYPRFISLLLEYMMPKYKKVKLMLNPTQVFSVYNWASKPKQLEGTPFTNHMLAICKADVPMESKAPRTSSKAEKKVSQGKIPRAKTGLRRKQYSKHTSESKNKANKGTNPSVLVDNTKSIEDELKTTHTNLGTNVESSSAKISKTIKLEDSSKLMHDVKTDFMDLDSPKDEPIFVQDKNEEAEEADKYEDTHATSHEETEDSLVPYPPSLKIIQLRELTNQVLLLQSQNQKLDLIPFEPKELSSMITILSGEVKELKKHVKEMEFELPEDLKELPTKLDTFTSTVSSPTFHVAELKTLQWKLPADFLALPSQVSSVQAKLKTLDALTSLLNKVTDNLNMFAHIMEIASPKAGDTNVPSTGKADAEKANLKKQPTPKTPQTTSAFQSPFSSSPPRSSPQNEGELIKKDKGKAIMSSKDDEEEETESDFENDHANTADSMVESFKKS